MNERTRYPTFTNCNILKSKIMKATFDVDI